MELFEEAPKREELANFSLPQMSDQSCLKPLENIRSARAHCPLFGCGWSHIDYKHLRGHLAAHREQLLKGDAWQKEGYPADMLRSKDGKSVDRDNVESVKIFNPQMIKRRGCSSDDEKQADKWETFEKFADRVFNAAKIDVSAAKRLWYKRSEVQARLQKWIYELDIAHHQKYKVGSETHPSKLFYDEKGEKRTIDEVRAKVRYLKEKRHADAKRAEERQREYEEKERQEKDREDRGDRDRDRRGSRDIQVRRKRDRQDEGQRDEEKKPHSFVVVKKARTGQ
jgi:hypothetical protein